MLLAGRKYAQACVLLAGRSFAPACMRTVRVCASTHACPSASMRAGHQARSFLAVDVCMVTTNGSFEKGNVSITALIARPSVWAKGSLSHSQSLLILKTRTCTRTHKHTHTCVHMHTYAHLLTYTRGSRGKWGDFLRGKAGLQEKK